MSILGTGHREKLWVFLNRFNQEHYLNGTTPYMPSQRAQTHAHTTLMTQYEPIDKK